MEREKGIPYIGREGCDGGGVGGDSRGQFGVTKGVVLAIEGYR